MDSIFNLSTRVDSIVCTDIDLTQVFDSIQNTSNMIFQSEPNGWMKLLVPVFTSLFVVCLGWIYNKLEKKREERVQRKKYRHTILTCIEFICPKGRELEKSLKVLSKQLQNSDSILPEPYGMPLVPFKKMNELSIESMIDSFVLGRKNKKYSEYVYNIVSSFDFLTEVTSEIHEKYEIYNKTSNDLVKEWNSLYEKLSLEFISDSVYKDLLSKWTTTLLFMPNFSRQTNLFYINQLWYKSASIKDKNMVLYFNQMRQILLQSDALHKGYSKVFSDIADNIENTLRALIKIKEEIEYSESCWLKKYELKNYSKN